MNASEIDRYRVRQAAAADFVARHEGQRVVCIRTGRVGVLMPGATGGLLWAEPDVGRPFCMALEDVALAG